MGQWAKVTDALRVRGLEASLTELDMRLRDATEAAPSSLARYLAPIAAQGKRLRGAIAYTCASLGEPSHPAVLDAMTAVELLHLATLVHDDIIDEDESRRGASTVNHSLGVPAAVVAGDRLIAQSLSTAARSAPLAAELLADALVTMCDAQFDESKHLYDQRRTIGHVIQVAEGKTASLFQAACWVGGIAGELAKEERVAIGEFGHAFGLGFQLLDDLQDLTSARNDLTNGVFTDAVVTAIERDPAIADLLTDGAPTSVIVRRAEECGAIREARHRASDWFTRAVAALNALNGVEAATDLVRLAELYRIQASDVTLPL